MSVGECGCVGVYVCACAYCVWVRCTKLCTIIEVKLL